MIATGAAPFALSSQRPVPLMRRRDLVIAPMSFQGVRHYVVKDPVALKYHRLQAEHFRTLQLLDGKSTLEDIRDELIREFPAIRPSLQQTQEIITSLHQQGLASGNREGQGHTRTEQQREQQRAHMAGSLLNVLSIRLPGFDPERVFKALMPHTRWIYHPATLFAAALLVLASWILVSVQFEEFQSRLPAFSQFFGWRNLAWMWLLLGVTKIFHEFGHGLTCRYFGAECNQIGVMLLAFVPSLYCDVSDSWMLKNKWQRIAIGAGGMIIESTIAAIALFVWWFTHAGLLNTLALNVFFVSTVTTVIFNLNPLMRLDGYYMLSDLWEIPNLRQRADRALHRWLAELTLGATLVDDGHQHGPGHQGWVCAYSITSMVYGWSVVSGMLLGLYSWLKPYGLQSIGSAVAVAGVSGVVTGMVMTGYQVWRLPRQQPLKPARVATSIVCVVAVLAALVFVPVPWFRTAAFVLEPYDVRHVHTMSSGELIELAVQPGDNVRAGQLLARLDDPEKLLRRQTLLTEQQLQTQEMALQQWLEDWPAAALAREARDSAERELAELDADLQTLTIVAPCDGVVVSPQRLPTPKLEQTRVKLASWSGTPLDAKNAGCFLKEKSPLLDVAPSPRWQAVIYLDQSDLDDVRTMMSLRLMFEHRPGVTYDGHIREIAPAQLDVVPAGLSSKHGGPLSTVTTREGQEKLEDAVYQAIVDFQAQPADVESGVRGEARFIVANRTVAQWFWRAFRRTFNFRL